MYQAEFEFGADYEAQMAKMAEYVELNVNLLDRAEKALRSGKKLAAGQHDARLGVEASTRENAEQMLIAVGVMRDCYEDIGKFPELCAEARGWDGVSEPDAVGKALEWMARAERERARAEAQKSMSREEWEAQQMAEERERAAQAWQDEQDVLKAAAQGLSVEEYRARQAAAMDGTMALSLSGVKGRRYRVVGDNVGLAQHLSETATPIDISFQSEQKGTKDWMNIVKRHIKENLAGKIFSIGNTGKRVKFASSSRKVGTAVKGVRTQKKAEAGKKLEEVISKAYLLSSQVPSHKDNESQDRFNLIEATDLYEVFGYPVSFNGEEAGILWFGAHHAKGSAPEELTFYQFGIAERLGQKERQRAEYEQKKAGDSVVVQTTRQDAGVQRTTNSPDEITLGEVLVNVKGKIAGMPEIKAQADGVTMSSLVPRRLPAFVREMEEIKVAAQADGTWLKAPNGKESNLPEDLWCAVRTAAFKGWFGDWEDDPANASKVVDENGEPKRVYHGTARADRVGDVFLPERATSGPMAFFTDNFAIAGNYARDKQDTSLAYEEEDASDYRMQFRVKLPNGLDVPFHKYWGYMPFAERNRLTKLAGHITEDDDGNIVVDETVNYGTGEYDWNLKEARGNVFEALVVGWLESGMLYGKEEVFLEVLDKLKLPIEPYYKDPNYREEKVYECFMRITNPFYTGKLTKRIVNSLRAASKKAKTKESRNADFWDKNSRSAEVWMEKLEEDYAEGTDYSWTSIPDWVTEWMKSKGYDGIVDRGGKHHDIGHTVYIPFGSNQVKSATDNVGSYDGGDARITHSVIGRHAKTWDRYADRVFAGRADGKMRAEIDASGARLKKPSGVRILKLLTKLKDGELRKKLMEREALSKQVLSEGLSGAEAARIYMRRDELDDDIRWLVKGYEIDYGLSGLVDEDGDVDKKLAGLLVRDEPMSEVAWALIMAQRENGQEFKLGDVLEFDELYEAYPDAKEIRVVWEKADRDAAGYFDEWGNAIHVFSDRHDFKNEVLDTLLHEVQHWIQRVEGFARGGNKASARRKMDEAVEEMKRLRGRLEWINAPAVAMNNLELMLRLLDRPKSIKKMGLRFEVHEVMDYKVMARQALEILEKDYQALWAMDRAKGWTTYYTSPLYKDGPLPELSDLFNEMDDTEKWREVRYCMEQLKKKEKRYERGERQELERKMNELWQETRYSDYSDRGLYLILPGELEARAVEVRRYMSEEQRGAESFNETYERVRKLVDAYHEMAYPDEVVSKMRDGGKFVSFSVIGRRAKTWGRYDEGRRFKGRDDGMERVEIDASGARLNDGLFGLSVYDLEARLGEQATDEERGLWDDFLMHEETLKAVANTRQTRKNKQMLFELSVKAELAQSKLGKGLAGLAERVLRQMGVEGLDLGDRDVLHAVLGLRAGMLGKAFPLKRAKFTLAEVLDYGELYEAYPELGGMEVRVKVLAGDTAGFYDRESGCIMINKRFITRPDEVRNTLLHEVQHAIQYIEGFAKGGNSSDLGRKNYLRSAGEIEARNVEGRSDWDMVRRGAVAFNDTLEYPGEAVVSFSMAEVKRMDAEYMAAVERGDMETAQRMVNEYAAARGYVVDDPERKMMHQAPSFVPGTMEDHERYGHVNGEDLALGSGIVPKDYWTHPQYYQTEAEQSDAFYKVRDFIEKTREWKNGERAKPPVIRMYRAVAKTREEKPRNGDWVSPSREYAVNHGKREHGSGKYTIQLVCAKPNEVWWDGNDITEWGYDDGKNYAYQNTANNRKLLDAVTYDYDGNVVPLSKRFNKRELGVSFSQVNRPIYRVQNDNVGLSDYVNKAVSVIEINYEKDNEDVDWRDLFKFYIKNVLAGRDIPIGETGHSVYFIAKGKKIDTAAKGIRGQRRGEVALKIEEVIRKSYKLVQDEAKHKEGEGRERKKVINFSDKYYVFGCPVRINGEYAVVYFSAYHEKGVEDNRVRFYEFGIANDKKEVPTDVQANIATEHGLRAYRTVGTSDSVILGDLLSGVNINGMPEVREVGVNGVSSSVVSSAQAARMMLKRRDDDMEGEELVGRWDELLARLETASTGKRDGAAKLGAMIALMESTRKVLPPEYAKLGKLNMLMKWAAVYAYMVSTGEVKQDGVLKGAIYDKFVQSMQKQYEGGMMKGLGYEDAKGILQDIGEKRLDEQLLKVAAECRKRVDMFVKARARERIESIAEKAYPKKERGRKSPRGKMEASRYRAISTMLMWMDATVQKVNERVDAIRAALEKMDGDEVSGEADGVSREELEEELRIVQLYGDWKGMSSAQAVRVADDFAQYVTDGRHGWEERLEREKRQREWRRMKMRFTQASNANTRSGEKREEGVRRGIKRGLKAFMVNSMSYAQLMLAGRKVFGDEFCRERRQELADANASLRNARRERDDAFTQALMNATGLRTEKELVAWLNKFGKVEVHTGIMLRQMTFRTLEMSREDAEAWCAMSREERQVKRAEAYAEAERKKEAAPNVPAEEEMEKLKAELDRLNEAGSKAAKVKVKVPRRGEPIELKASRDGVANAILLLEQEDYQHLIEYEGLTPRDADGNEIDREAEADLPEEERAVMDVEQTLKPLYDFIGEDGRAFVYALREYVGQNGKRMQKVYEEYQGVPLAMKQKYWRGNFNINTIKEKDTLTDKNGAGGNGGGGYGFLIDRVRHYNRLEWTNTATMVFGVTVEAQNNYTFTSGITREWRALLADTEFQKQMEVELGRPYMTALKEWLDIIDGVQKGGSAATGWLARLQNKASRGLAYSALAGNGFVLVKQASAILHGLLGGEVPRGVVENSAGVKELEWRKIGLVRYIS